MTCLNDSHIQPLADGEGSGELQRHAAACASCAERLRARQARMVEMRAAIDPATGVPPAFAARLKRELDTPGSAVAGATRLRGGAAVSARRQRRWIAATMAVAATAVAVLFIAPAIRRGDATVSAAEILARSATQLSAAARPGIEVLEYELVLDGVPKEILPDQVGGAYRVWQAIDHNVPGKFRFATYTPDGRLFSSIAEDPSAHRRVASFSAEGQAYRFDVTLPDGARNLSLPEMQRIHMQASIAMMQAAGNQLLETVDGPAGKLYRIEVPSVAGPGSNPVWDLSEGRVAIDARDYSIVEFAVRGAFLKQAYSMSYKLLKHQVGATLDPAAFNVPNQPGEIVISGEGSAVPTQDVFLLSLRELRKLQQAR